MNVSDLMANYHNLSLKKLDTIVKKNGFEYRLIKRNTERFIYAQHNKAGKIVAYEMFLNKIKPYRKLKEMWAKKKNEVIDLDSIPEYYETFPSDEEFGSRAWTYSTLEKAELAFDSK